VIDQDCGDREPKREDTVVYALPVYARAHVAAASGRRRRVSLLRRDHWELVRGSTAERISSHKESGLSAAGSRTICHMLLLDSVDQR